MTTHEPGTDVRHSTLHALKLTCPSAEVLDSPYNSDAMDNGYHDGDSEWSDEEQLIPKGRRKTQYVAPHAHIQKQAAVLAAEEKWARSSSEETSPVSKGSHRSSLNPTPSPLLPPKSPSRPEVKPGSNQDDLVERFYQVTRERDALRKQLQRKSMGPNGVPQPSVIYKSEESSMVEELLALRTEIRNWCEDYFGGPASSRRKRPHVNSSKDMFSNLTDNYALYLKHSTDRPLLIQAYLWNKLYQRIFSNLLSGCGYFWAGKLGDRKLRPINDTLRRAVKNEEDAEAYHRWRALTVNLLVPQVDGRWRPTFDPEPILKRISRFCSRLRRRLRPWSTHSLSEGKEQLHTIVSAAIALDLKMKRQRADYRFITFTGGKSEQLYGYSFFESEMENIEVDDGKPRKVELCLAPALERCGNSNGYVFDQPFMLVKADVSCKRLSSSSRNRHGRGGRTGIRSVFNLWNR